MSETGSRYVEATSEIPGNNGFDDGQSDGDRQRQSWTLMGEEGEIDLRNLLRTLWRRKAVIIATFFTGILIASIIVFQLTPIYTSDASLMVNTRKTQVVDFEAVLSGISTDAGAILAEVEILKSRTLAEKVIVKLGLLNDPEFNSALAPKKGFFATLNENNQFISEELLATLSGWKSIITGGNAKEEPLPEEKERRVMTQAVATILENLSVAPIRRSPVIKVIFNSKSPQKAALIVNTLTQEYLRDQLEAKFEATQRATNFLNDKLGDLLVKLRTSEKVVEVYRQSKGLIEKKGATLDAQQMSELNSKVIIAQVDRAEAEARLKQVKTLIDSGSSLDSVAEVLSAPLIQRLREQETILLRKASELSTEYGERHPKMINVRAESRDLRAKIESEVRKIVKGLQNQVGVARARESSLRSSVRLLQRRVVAQTRDEIKLRELERDAKANRAIYGTYLARFNETSLQVDAQTADARIISKAEISQFPTFPRKKLILLLAAVGSGFMGVVLVFLLERLDNGFRSPEQIEKMTGIPSLGMVPMIRGFFKKQRRIDRYVHDSPMSSVSESIRNLKTSLRLSNVDHPPKILCVTSSVPSEGKSTVSLWLAQVAAISGEKALIIDCDLRRPQLHINVGASNDQNLVNFLSGEQTFEEAVFRDKVTGVSMLFARPISGNPIDLLQSDKMSQFLEKAKSEFDLVVLDSPPILPVADAKILSRLADKTIYLIKWDETPREAVLAGLKQLVDIKAEFAGVLLSQVDVKKHARYGYGDQGYYYGRYKEYYSD